MAENEIDLAIVGSGAAGLSAALYAGRRMLKTRCFEKGAVGGYTSKAIHVENYPGIKFIKGLQLAKQMQEHAEKFGVKVEQGMEVTKIEKKGGIFELTLNGKEKVKAKAVILAVGSVNKKLNVPGEEELLGRGVSYCALCDALFFRNKRVVVVGGGNNGADSASYLHEIASDVKLVEVMEKLACDECREQKLNEKGVEILRQVQVKEILGKERVAGIKARDLKTGKEKTIEADGVFILIGFNPNNALAKQLGLELDERGFIKIDRYSMQASLPGIFAPGDINGGLAQIVVAAGQGAVAAMAAYYYIHGLKR